MMFRLRINLVFFFRQKSRRCVEHRPQAWKGQLAQEMIKAAEEAVEETMRRCEGNGDEEGTSD